MQDSVKKEKLKTIAFVHHKGGTGKTTSCINIAGWLVKMKKQVLVVDLDPQGNATAGLGIDRKTVDSSTYDLLFAQERVGNIILETDSGIHLAPSSLDLLAVETHMPSQIDNTGILREKLSDIGIYFDYVLIDVPPGSTLLMINGIVASENIIIPLDSGIFAYETMETLKTLLLYLNEEIGIETNVMMMLLRKYSSSMFDNGQISIVRKLLKSFIDENLDSEVDIFNIPYSKQIFKAQMNGLPISHYAPYSTVGKVYERIAKKILKKY